jgi:WD40 repeat protein
MFDPYHRWLGIPRGQRPPTYYQLLGIAADEADTEVIEEAALRQASHVRLYQTGPHAQQCTTILNEIGQARAVLLNADKRKHYDDGLGQTAGAAPAVPLAEPQLVPPTALAEPVRTPPPQALVSARAGQARFSPGVLFPALGFVAVLALGAGLTLRLAQARPGAASSPQAVQNNSASTVPDELAGQARDDRGRSIYMHESAVYGLGVGPNGWSVLSAGGGYAAGAEGEPLGCSPRLWSMRTGQVSRLFEGHRSPVLALACSANGERFLTGSGGYEWRDDTLTPVDCTVRLWQVAQASERLVFTEHQAPVRGVALHPDGNQVVSCSCDGTVYLWDLQGKHGVRRLPGRPFPAVCVALSPDGRHVLAGGSDGALRLWESPTYRQVGRFPVGSSPVWAVAVSPDGRHVASASGSFEHREGQIVARDCVARVWDLASGEVLQTLHGHTRPVRALAFARRGRWALTGGLDGTVRLWDARTGKQLHRFEGPAGGITCVLLLRERREVLAGALDGSVWAWRLPDKLARVEAEP